MHSKDRNFTDTMTKVINLPCPVEARTPRSSSLFFGFHDLCPWNPANTDVALLSCPATLLRVPDGTDWADVCIWNPSSNELRTVGGTTAWNFQQGARLQWLKDGTLLFNILDGTAAKSRIVDAEGHIVRELPMAVGVVSPDEAFAISPSFGRLGKYWKAYGYGGAIAPGLEDPCPKNDGLWAIDMKSGDTRLLVSISDIASASVSTIARANHFVCHPLFNRSGTRFAFMHRFFSADGALFTRLFVCRRDGSKLTLLASEKVSHFDWKDEDTLVVWSRFARGGLGNLRARGILNLPILKMAVKAARKMQGPLKARLLTEYYHLISVEDPERRDKVAPDVLLVDGHPMLHPQRPVMVSDTYPDSNRMLHLFLYDFDNSTYVEIGSFIHGVATTDIDLKCDLHPRWDRRGEKVAVDICEDGVRRLALVDARPALAALTN